MMHEAVEELAIDLEAICWGVGLTNDRGTRESGSSYPDTFEAYEVGTL